MVVIQIFLFTVLTSLISANALIVSTTPQRARPRLVFPKVGEAVVLPTTQVQESRPPVPVQGVLPLPKSPPVRRYAVHEDTVPAAYHYYQPGGDGTMDYHDHQDADAYHHPDGAGVEDYHHHPHDPPKYAYKYSIHDDHTGDYKKAWEHRDGDVTHGGYTVLDPDGHLRIVEYTVTKKGGFQAKVRRVPNY